MDVWILSIFSFSCDRSHMNIDTTNTLNGPWGIGFAGGPDPELFIADAIKGRVIMVPLNGGDASDLNFTGLLADPILGEPRGLVITEAALFITDGAKNRIIRTTGPDENDGIDVVVTSTIGDIGDTVTVELKLDNQDSTYVGGFQASVKVQDLSRACILEVENTNQVPDFTVSFVQTDSVAHFIIFSASGDSIAPNPADSLSCFATIKILIQGPTEGGAATRGDFVDLDVFNVQAGNPQGEPLNAGDHDGRVFIGIRCDTNFDGQINILDIISLIRNIVNNTLPDGNTTGFVVSNAADSDDDLNVADAIAIVNKILGVLQQSVGKQVPTGPVAINLSEPITLANGQQAIPVRFDGQSLIAGAQATFTFDPKSMKVGTPFLPGNLAGIFIDSRIEAGTLRVLIHGITPETRVPVDQSPVLLIPITLLHDGRVGLTLTEAVLADWRAQIVPVQYGMVTQTLTRGADVPGTFSLAIARPNPFNPSTTIAYEVPQPAHMTLVVYNLLGQEVVRLVDQVQQSGRYTATWNAVNTQGHTVASGVYMYRITSSTGYAQSQRMTLLK
jgi:hypothetical protein